MLSEVVTEITVSILATLIIAVVVYIYRRAITIRLQAWLLRQKGIGITNVYTHRTDARLTVAKRLQSAKVIWYMGIKGLDIIGHREIMFSDLALALQSDELKRGEVRFLLLDPDSEYNEVRAHEMGHEVDSKKRGIKHTLDDLVAMNQYIDNVDVKTRLYDSLPVWNLLFLGDVLFLAFYLKGIAGFRSLCLEILRPSALFLAFEKYYTVVWKDAKPFPSQ
jgi:hypothetical protein